MIQVIGVVASILGIVAFFAVAPKDLVANLKGWFVDPIKSIKKKKNKLSLQELFEYLMVEDIRIENSFVSRPLTSDSFDSELTDYKGKLPERIEKLKTKELARYSTSNDGRTFDNNASFALRRIDVSRPEGGDGKRNNIYKLILEPTDYYSFVFPNLFLDKSYYDENTQEDRPLRDLLSLSKESLSISTLTEHPDFQFKVGTGTLLITKDNYLICSVRSNKQFVAGKQNGNEIAVHLSAAEGMYRSRNVPSSSDCIDGKKPSPFATSARSLTDELNLTEDQFKPSDICCLGYYFDLKRAQPFFLFCLRLNLSVDELFSEYSNTSKDIHENDAIFALPVEFNCLKLLFEGVTLADISPLFPKLYRDYFKSNSSSKIRIASNQAKAGFATCIFKEFFPITRGLMGRNVFHRGKVD